MSGESGGGQYVRQNPFLENIKKSSFGRRDWITSTDDPNRGLELARIDTQCVQDWTVTIDVWQYIAGTAVVAHIEYGSGNTISQLDFDATDHVDVPVSGDHVRVWITVLNVSATPPFGALVGVQISAETWATLQPTENAGPNAFGGAAVDGVVSAVGARLKSFHAYSTQAVGGATEYLMFFDSAGVVPPNGTVPQEAFALLPAANVEHTWAHDRPFTQGLVWAVSTTPGTLTLSASTAMVSVELTRTPRSEVVTTIGSTG